METEERGLAPDDPRRVALEGDIAQLQQRIGQAELLQAEDERTRGKPKRPVWAGPTMSDERFIEDKAVIPEDARVERAKHFAKTEAARKAVDAVAAGQETRSRYAQAALGQRTSADDGNPSTPEAGDETESNSGEA
jgi:hypothetical protein